MMYRERNRNERILEVERNFMDLVKKIRLTAEERDFLEDSFDRLKATAQSFSAKLANYEKEEKK